MRSDLPSAGRGVSGVCRRAGGSGKRRTATPATHGGYTIRGRRIVQQARCETSLGAGARRSGKEGAHGSNSNVSQGMCRASAAWRSRRDPWLCVPASQPVCLYRVARNGATGSIRKGTHLVSTKMNRSRIEDCQKTRPDFFGRILSRSGEAGAANCSPVLRRSPLPTAISGHRHRECHLRRSATAGETAA